MVVVAFVVFSLLYLTPGDPAVVIAGDIATEDGVIEDVGVVGRNGIEHGERHAGLPERDRVQLPATGQLLLPTACAFSERQFIVGTEGQAMLDADVRIAPIVGSVIRLDGCNRDLAGCTAVLDVG